jgi:hypothetical protein
MTPIGGSEAIELARKFFRATSSVTGEAAPVRRLDGGPAYYLVTLRDRGRAVAVATVDALRGEIRESARITNGRSPLEIGKEEAVKLSGLRSPRSVELVWQPSRATRSPLYPVWRVMGEAVAYVDQQGKVWHDLK